MRLLIFKAILYTFSAVMQTFVCIVRLICGKDAMYRIVQELARDPSINAQVSKMGMGDVMQRFQAQASQMRTNNDPEAQEWGKFIQNYGEGPIPDAVPLFLQYVQDAERLKDHFQELPTAAAVLSLAERHPDVSEKWRQDFPEVFYQANGVLLRCGEDRAGWNDHHMVRWFVLRQDEIAAEIVKRTAIPGQVGQSCAWMVSSVAQAMPAFKETLDRVGWSPPQTHDIDELPAFSQHPGRL